MKDGYWGYRSWLFAILTEMNSTFPIRAIRRPPPARHNLKVVMSAPDQIR